jgi:hypothetical protein
VIQKTTARRQPDGIAFAVADFLADLRLEGRQRVLGSLALELAEALEEALGYSKARLARELRELVNELHRTETEWRRNEAFEVKVASQRAEHEAGVRRQKALLAKLGVPDVPLKEVQRRSAPCASGQERSRTT